MKLACEGCDAVLQEETADALLSAMMEHGEEAHSNLFEGKSAEELQQMRGMMEAHVRQMIVDQN